MGKVGVEVGVGVQVGIEVGIGMDGWISVGGRGGRGRRRKRRFWLVNGRWWGLESALV